jgi:hypothetical protein
MRKIYIITIILVSIINYGCKKSIPSEKEPNNTIETATPFEINSKINGFIDTETDRDFYSFTINEDSVAEINLSGLKGVNLSFRIFKSGKIPELMKLVDDNRKSSPEAIKNLSLSTGNYHIVVMHGTRDPRRKNRETPYQLEMKAEFPGDEEAEPNDRPARANLLTEGGEVRGYFSPRYNWLNESGENKYREEDYYKFEIDEDLKLPALVSVYLTGVEGVNSTVYLYSSRMKLIGESPETVSGKPSEIRNMGIKEPGTYYILVTTKKFDENKSEPYSLSYTIDEHSSSQELEPNNSRSEANSVQENIIRGSIGSVNDSDFFLYETGSEAKERSYRLEIIPEAEIDLMMKIYSREGELLFDINNTESSETEILPNFFTGSDFHIEVYARTFSEKQSGNYTLSITSLEGEGLESEPNNSKEKADSIESDFVTGYISGKRDVDYFLLTDSKRKMYHFSCTPPSSGKIKISVTDPLGYKIKTVDVAGEKKVTFNEMIDRRGYIIVESVIDDFRSPYTITITEETR